MAAKDITARPVLRFLGRRDRKTRQAALRDGRRNDGRVIRRDGLGHREKEGGEKDGNKERKKKMTMVHGGLRSGVGVNLAGACAGRKRKA